MIISKNTQIKDLQHIEDGDKIEITKELALNRQFLTMLMTKFPNSTVTILSGYNANITPYSLQNPFFNIEETNLFIAEGYSMERAKAQTKTTLQKTGINDPLIFEQ